MICLIEMVLFNTYKTYFEEIKEHVAQWVNIAHLRTSIPFGDTINYDAHLNLKM